MKPNAVDAEKRKVLGGACERRMGRQDLGIGSCPATEEERMNAVNVGVAGRWFDRLGSALASVRLHLMTTRITSDAPSKFEGNFELRAELAHRARDRYIAVINIHGYIPSIYPLYLPDVFGYTYSALRGVSRPQDFE